MANRESLSGITFSEIHGFNVAVETGSVTRAAHQLGITQPAVSKQLRRLERKLNVILFDRTSKRLRLTVAGQHFHAYTSSAFAAFEDTIQAVRQAGGLLKGELRIAASTTPGDYLVPRWINEFKALYPALEAVVSISDSEQVIAEVIDRSWDVGFVGGMPSDSSLVCHAIGEDEVVLAVRSDHPFASRGEVRLRELEGQLFIGREPGSATLGTVQRALEAHNLRPPDMRVVMILNTTQASLSAVQRGIGICWASVKGLENQVMQGLAPVRISEVSFKRTLYMIHMKRGLPPVAEAFVQWLLASMNDREMPGFFTLPDA